MHIQEDPEVGLRIQLELPEMSRPYAVEGQWMRLNPSLGA
jgi:hypothetical protein